MNRPSRQDEATGGWRLGRALGLFLLLGDGSAARGADDRFEEQVLPVLEDRCYSCHGNGIKKGGLDLEALAGAGLKRGEQDQAWFAVLRNVRSGMMPPADKPQITPAEQQALEAWIKGTALGIDPGDPDPGRMTLRRLNRVEYRNTVRDLVGVDFDTTSEFPPDDTGHGFDNIGDVLSLSPLLLEKYLAASKAIIAQAVPTVPTVAAERTIAGRQFRRAGGKPEEGAGPLTLPYYEPATVAAEATVDRPGRYQVLLDFAAVEKYVDGVNDYNKCRLIFRVDGAEVARRELVRQGNQTYHFEVGRDWAAGPHELAVAIEPLTPDAARVRSLAVRLNGVTVRGPMAADQFVRPANYERFFPGTVPADPAGQRAYSRDLLARFAARAFRRPVDAATADRLADLAIAAGTEAGQTFEAGVAHAMAAVLTSPRFLFREEGVETGPAAAGRFPLVDEYGLATRMSYFFWATMPDAELTRLADAHQLRASMKEQVARLLADGRSNELIRHFVGQWLQARDVDTVLINAAAVVGRDEVPDPAAEQVIARFRELRRKAPETLSDAEKAEIQAARAEFGRRSARLRDLELSGDLRTAMRRETELTFEHVVRQDRSLLELIDSDYTFLNERLARFYGIAGVQGDAMRRVTLPPDSPRGGVLTQASVLTVTSNPDRTSPVKRGLFLLDNILGTPPAPPPPNIPSLEEAGQKAGGRVLTLRESMKLHQDNPTCASCHARMDPLGLALENFDALGRYRDRERAAPIDPAGRLATGEAFRTVRDLKRTLATARRRDFYRCLTEKLLTYALGRGLEAGDVDAVDAIVGRLEAEGGRASVLLAGIVDSAAFQKRRPPAAPADEGPATLAPADE